MPDGRFAPSPTGDLHLGNLRTAVLAWLFARSAGSSFVVRMEDLDPASRRAGVEQRQLDDLRAIGLTWDGEVVRQSERLALYDDAIAQLERGEHTYPCYCTRREIQQAAAAPHGDAPEGAYPGTCRDLSQSDRAERERSGRPPALRVRADGVRIAFIDRVCGLFDGLVDDVVIRRNDGTPSYNLAVVVDDAAQGVGEVVRGDDLLPSTPRQLHLASLLDVTAPAYAHVPMVLGPDGARLAKRDGAVSLADRAGRNETPADVAGLLLASLGLAEPGAPASADDLVQVTFTFDPASLPREPWRLSRTDL